MHSNFTEVRAQDADVFKSLKQSKMLKTSCTRNSLLDLSVNVKQYNLRKILVDDDGALFIQNKRSDLPIGSIGDIQSRSKT